MSMLENGEKKGNRWIFLWLLNSLGGLDVNICSYIGFDVIIDDIIHHSYIDKKFD